MCRTARSPAFAALRMGSLGRRGGLGAAIGYLRLLGPAYAEVVSLSPMGDWIWHRVERLSTLAEIPAQSWWRSLILHASQYLSETLATCRNIPKAQRQRWYKALAACVAANQTEGVEAVQEALRRCTTHRSRPSRVPWAMWRPMRIACGI